MPAVRSCGCLEQKHLCGCLKQQTARRPQAAMTLSGEQQDWLAGLAEALVQRIANLGRRHHSLSNSGDDCITLKLRPPVSLPAATCTAVRRLHQI